MDASRELLSELFSHPTTFRIFMLLRQTGEELGVRAIQRKLDLGSPSTAYWHLNKLCDRDVVIQLPNNNYRLAEEYQQISTIDVPTALPVRIAAGYMVPVIFTPVFYLFFMIIGIVILLFLGMVLEAAIAGLIGLTAALALILNFIRQNALVTK